MEDLGEELWTVFSQEVREGVAGIEALIDRVERAGTADVQPELDAGFRLMHNVKGASRLAGIASIEAIARAIEEVFRNARSVGVVPTSDVRARLREGARLIVRVLEEREVGDAVDTFLQALSEARAGSRQEVPTVPNRAARAAAEARPAPVRTSLPSPESLLRARRVLVVDDSPSTRVMERNILAAAGYDVEVSADGQAAWETLQSSAFDLVVSDVQMPRLDGFGLVQRMRAHARLRRTPVILVTSLEQAVDRARGAEVGADDYIVKARFDRTRLLEAVARLI